MASLPTRPTGLLDRAGALWAGLCALHCLALPLAFVAAPALTAALYSFHAPQHGLAIALLRAISLEPWFIGISAAVSGLAIGHGAYWHRRWPPVVLALAGVASLALAWFGRLAFDGWAHLIGIGLGGALLVGAHLWNLRLLARLRRS
ncbi:hypothetical protein BV497_08840 [Fulvimonas soli]|uniref:MerC mercury resistance protein n=2 Tax=Fulvimonas soli TaxID=155197 RepID=A0A316IIV5_9GAMM|nr:MerC mercury resistance protein [Fulvimonas soli]TNY26403.1 hypothetical protein BV497_08840 [Fulvimonas soli]